MGPSRASLNEALSDGDTDAATAAAGHECECEYSEQPHAYVGGLSRVTGGPAACARLGYVETQSKHSR